MNKNIARGYIYESSTDALILKAHIDIRNPVVAFNVYRGTMFPTHHVINLEQAISFWMLSRLKVGDDFLRKNEFSLDHFRKVHYKNEVSRLNCLFMFEDLLTLEVANSVWGNNFNLNHVTDVVFDPDVNFTKVDSNWITYCLPRNRTMDNRDLEWMHAYWKGEAYPDADKAIWEMLVDGPGVICSDQLKEKCFQLILQHMPEALPFAELSRLASEQGSLVGISIPILFKDDNGVKINYICNMEDHFNGRLKELFKEKKLLSRVKIDKNLRTPDFSRYTEVLSKDKLIYPIII